MSCGICCRINQCFVSALVWSISERTRAQYSFPYRVYFFEISSTSGGDGTRGKRMTASASKKFTSISVFADRLLSLMLVLAEEGNLGCDDAECEKKFYSTDVKA